MALVPSETETANAIPAKSRARLLVMLAPVSHDALESTLDKVSVAFGNEQVAIAAPDLPPSALESFSQNYPNLQLLAESATTVHLGSWVLTASDFLNLYKAAEQNGVDACLLLGPEAHTLEVEALRGLADEVLAGTDLSVPHYEIGPREGLVNSALLYPVTRAIFGAEARFPLAVDLGLSLRMASRLATVAQRFTALNQNDALIWPVAEAAVAGYKIVEVKAGTRTLPQPTVADLNTLLAQIASSFFTEIETHAAFWQRVRVSPRTVQPGMPHPLAADTFPDVQPMLESFQLAYTNLHEIWSLVLPPNSLLSLKRLSQMPSDSFRMNDALWARIVYDFVLAYRLRTINRGHLLGALTPLYLAWVASHILLARAGGDPEQHVEEVAVAFESDKAYLVSRWRWPDRFNP